MSGTDGRTARRERNREEVVEAALSLIDEGEQDPSIEQLTQRSGLSARSIFRYFEGLDDLRVAVMRRHFERLRPLVEPADSTGESLEARIKRFVETRIKLNEAIAGPARTARMRAPHSRVMAEDVLSYRRLLDEQVKSHFAPELAGRSKAEVEDLVALISVVVSFDGWEALTTERQRTRAQVRRAWTRAISVLLGADEVAA